MISILFEFCFYILCAKTFMLLYIIFGVNCTLWLAEKHSQQIMECWFILATEYFMTEIDNSTKVLYRDVIEHLRIYSTRGENAL